MSMYGSFLFASSAAWTESQQSPALKSMRQCSNCSGRHSEIPNCSFSLISAENPGLFLPGGVRVGSAGEAQTWLRLVSSAHTAAHLAEALSWAAGPGGLGRVLGVSAPLTSALLSPSQLLHQHRSRPRQPGPALQPPLQLRRRSQHHRLQHAVRGVLGGRAPRGTIPLFTRGRGQGGGVNQSRPCASARHSAIGTCTAGQSTLLSQYLLR